MNAFISKTVLASAVTVACLFSGAASAATFNDFGVNPIGALPNFTADKITGNYNEIATFTGNTFNVSLLWVAGQFVAKDGTSPLSNKLKTGLGNDYNVYATYKASGTVVYGANGKTTFNFLPGTGSLQMFLDTQGDNDFSETVSPLNGLGNFSFDGGGNDTLIATGSALSGQGTLDPSLNTCGQSNGLNCGSFGSETSFALTAAGKLFFVSPNPFYNLSFQSGQLNNFTPSGTQEINGSLDVVFNEGEVPEPASIALLGLGLLGLGMSRRRKQK